MIHVRFEPDGRSLAVERGTTILDAARRAGLPMASACGADGICGRCGITVVAGGEGIDPEGVHEAETKRRNRVDSGQRLACRVAPSSDVTVTASYW